MILDRVFGLNNLFNFHRTTGIIIVCLILIHPILIFIYQLNEELEDFEQIEVKENVPLFELLDSNEILLFVDMHDGKVWIWEGKNTSTRMKFISAQAAPHIRDKYDLTFTISSVDENDETIAFKLLVGLV